MKSPWLQRKVVRADLKKAMISPEWVAWPFRNKTLVERCFDKPTKFG
jgi:hypothetical protein